MIYFNLTAGATTNNTPVGITVINNTNNNSKLNSTNNGISIINPGIYRISGTVTLTSAASGEFGVGIYANNSLQSSTSYAGNATASGETYTVPVYAIIDVEKSSSDGYVLINILTTGTPSISSGYISIDKIS